MVLHGFLSTTHDLLRQMLQRQRQRVQGVTEPGFAGVQPDFWENQLGKPQGNGGLMVDNSGSVLVLMVVVDM